MTLSIVGPTSLQKSAVADAVHERRGRVPSTIGQVTVHRCVYFRWQDQTVHRLLPDPRRDSGMEEDDRPPAPSGDQRPGAATGQAAAGTHGVICRARNIGQLNPWDGSVTSTAMFEGARQHSWRVEGVAMACAASVGYLAVLAIIEHCGDAATEPAQSSGHAARSR